MSLKGENVFIQDRIHGKNQKSFLYITVDIIQSTHKKEDNGNKPNY